MFFYDEPADARLLTAPERTFPACPTILDARENALESPLFRTPPRRDVVGDVFPEPMPAAEATPCTTPNAVLPAVPSALPSAFPREENSPPLC